MIVDHSVHKRYLTKALENNLEPETFLIQDNFIFCYSNTFITPFL